MLMGAGTQNILNIVVGMYNEWDKSPRRYVPRECNLNFDKGVCENEVWGLASGLFRVFWNR